MLPSGWSVLGLEEQISPIFGLTLLELVEHIAAAGIGIAIVSSIFAMGALIVSAIQIKKQSKVSSANLILELVKPWRQKDFQKLLNEIANHDITKYDEGELEKLLNQLEDIATFWKDDTLSEIHVKEFFGSNLKTVRDDKFIQDFIKKWASKNSDYYFVNLRELIKKVKDWKI